MDHFVNEYFTYIVPNIFLPEARKGGLDGDQLSKMGLTNAHMIEGDALFF